MSWADTANRYWNDMRRFGRQKSIVGSRRQFFQAAAMRLLESQLDANSAVLRIALVPGREATREQLLTRLARELKSRFGSQDVILGVFDERLNVFFGDHQQRHAETLAEMCLHTCRELLSAAASIARDERVAVGAASVQLEHQGFEVSLLKSTLACDMALELGGDCWKVYNSSNYTQSLLVEHQRAIGQFYNRLCGGSVVLAYQEIAGLQPNSKPNACEILVRDIEEPIPGSAHNALKRASRLGITALFDAWVLENTVNEMLGGELRDYDEVAVNISFSSLANPEFLDFVARLYCRSETLRNRLCLEISEGALLTGQDDRIAALKHNVRCRVGIDDYCGQNFSKTLVERGSVEYVKIDSSELQDLSRGKNLLSARELVENALRCEVTPIVKRVENRDQLARALHAGVEIAQGYFFHEPVLIAKFSRGQRAVHDLLTPADSVSVRRTRRPAPQGQKNRYKRT